MIGQYAIIFIDEPQIRAIGEGGEVEWDGITYTVSTQVGYNEAVAPTGNSISSGEVKAHLHLFLFADASLNSADGKTKNPLEELVYPQPTYSAATTITNGYDTNPTSVRVQLSMNGQGGGAGGYSVVQNANIVGFRMRHLGEDVHPELIKGKIWGYISLGGKLNGAPGNAAHPAHITQSGNANKGSATKTGVDPFAYRNDPWDDYYFSDFYTRIHKSSVPGSDKLNLAGRAFDARHDEGEYEIMPSLTTINGELN